MGPLLQGLPQRLEKQALLLTEFTLSKLFPHFFLAKSVYL